MARSTIYEEVAGIGKSYADAYMQGTKIRLAEEQVKRAQRKESFSYIRNVADTANQMSVIDIDSANTFLDNQKKTESWKRAVSSLGTNTLDIETRLGKVFITDEVSFETASKAPNFSEKTLNNLGIKTGANVRIKKAESGFILDIEGTQDRIKKGLEIKGKEFENLKESKRLLSDTEFFEMGSKLRKEFQGITKDFRDIRNSYTRVTASAKDPSAAGDLSLIFNYMKMLDPASVVRESEFAQAAKSGSLGDRFIASGEKLVAGKRLSDSMRNDFIDRSKRLYIARNSQYKKTSQEYTTLSEKYNIDPSRVVLDYELPDQGDINKDLNFSSIEEAERKKLPLGTIIYINGRKAVVE